MHENKQLIFPFEWLSTRTRFETEACSNSEMGYLTCFIPSVQMYVFNTLFLQFNVVLVNYGETIGKLFYMTHASIDYPLYNVPGKSEFKSMPLALFLPLSDIQLPSVAASNPSALSAGRI